MKKEYEMNEILKCIHERRSIKSYKSKMPSTELLDKVILAGLDAASGRNKQGAIIVAVTDKSVRDALSETNAEILSSKAAIPGAASDPFYNAPAVLVVLADKSVNTSIYDASLVAGNMMLAAHSLGLGSCWIHRARETFATEKWQRWLRSIGIEGEYEGVANIIVGYREGEFPPEKPRIPGRVFKV